MPFGQCSIVFLSAHPVVYLGDSHGAVPLPLLPSQEMQKNVTIVEPLLSGHLCIIRPPYLIFQLVTSVCSIKVFKRSLLHAELHICDYSWEN